MKRVGIGLGQEGVLRHPRPAEDLHRAVDHPRGRRRHHDLGCGDQVARGLVALAVHLVGGAQRQQPRLLDVAERMRDVLAHRAVFGQRAAEGGAQGRAAAHQLQRALRAADQPHAVVNAPGTQPPLRDLEATALAEQQVGDRHAHVLVHDLRVPDRRVVVAEDVHVALDAHARRVLGHQDHRLAPVQLGMVGRGEPHHDQQLAVLVERAGGEPLAAVDDVMVAVAADLAAYVGGIAGRDFRLGHREGRADLSGQQRLQPSALLLGRAVLGEHLHVAGVGRRAVEHLAGPQHAAHRLGQRRVLQVAQPGTVIAGQEQVPQTLRPGQGLQPLHHRRRAMAGGRVAAAVHLLAVQVLGRKHVFVHEGIEPALELDDAGGSFEVHRQSPHSWHGTVGRSHAG